MGTQNDSDLCNLSPLCWQHLPSKGWESSISPRGIWPASLVAACLATGHILCFEVMEKQRCSTCGEGPAAGRLDYGPQPHSLYFSNFMPDNIPERGLQGLLSPLQGRANLPQLQLLVHSQTQHISKGTTAQQCLSKTTTGPEKLQNTAGCKVSSNYLTALKMQMHSPYLCCSPSSVHFPHLGAIFHSSAI